MTRNEAHCSDDYPQGRGRSLPEPPRHYVYNVMEPDGPGYGKLVGTWFEGSGFTPNFHGMDLGFQPQPNLPDGTKAEPADEKPTNENLNQGGTE